MSFLFQLWHNNHVCWGLFSVPKVLPKFLSFNWEFRGFVLISVCSSFGRTRRVVLLMFFFASFFLSFALCYLFFTCVWLKCGTFVNLTFPKVSSLSAMSAQFFPRLYLTLQATGLNWKLDWSAWGKLREVAWLGKLEPLWWLKRKTRYFKTQRESFHELVTYKGTIIWH